MPSALFARENVISRRNFDAVIIGGGIFGLSTAYSCILRGLKTCVLEKERIGAGASGGIVGALSPHLPDHWNEKKQFQFEALSEAPAYWQKIETLSGLATGFGRIGRLMLIPDLKTRMRSEAVKESAKLHWNGRYGFDILEEAPAFINAKHAPFGIIHEGLSARLLPRRALRALAQAVENLGGEIREGESVREIASGRIETDHAIYHAPRSVVADGVSGLERLSMQIGRPIGAAIKGQAALLHCDLGAIPQVFAEGLYIVPQAEGFCAVGSTSEDHFADLKTDDRLEALIKRAGEVVPKLKAAPVKERWVALRPKARRRNPLLGPHPDLKNVFVANGGFKIGFGIAPKIGEIMADFMEGAAPIFPKSFTFAHHLGRKDESARHAGER